MGFLNNMPFFIDANFTSFLAFYVVGAIVTIIHLYLGWLIIQGMRFTKDLRIDNHVIIVTGGNSGIGYETALELARRGARIYLGCRDFHKGSVTRHRIINATGNTEIYSFVLDLSSVRSIRRFVSDFLNVELRLDVLINNAAVMGLRRRKLTRDGFEMHFGVNHLGHFLLTKLLVETLKDSHPSRIVNLTSEMHRSGRIDADNLQAERYYSRFEAYNNSKLANVLFTRELARRLAGTGVTANCANPGAVRTRLYRHLRMLVILFYPVYAIFFKTAWAGSQTPIAVAIDPELAAVSGKYFGECAVREESDAAKCNQTAAWLWDKSEELLKGASARIALANRRRNQI